MAEGFCYKSHIADHTSYILECLKLFDDYRRL